MNLSTVELFKHLNTESDQVVCVEGSNLKRLQSILLEIAEDIISICDKENICYHLTGGTALGAIRHKGFIPWDDDLDIDILGSDFDRFIEVFNKEYGDKYWICTYKSPGYGILTNRIRLKGTVYRTREDAENDECGIFVDIFRIENVYNNVILRYLHGILCQGFSFLLSCRNFYKNRVLMLQLANGDKNVSQSFRLKINLGRLLSFFSVDKWAQITQACYSLCKNNNSKYVTVPPGRKHYFGEMRLRSDFVDTADAEFEGHTWKIPKDYIGYLKSMYGDNFMELPSEEDREKHIILELKFPEGK